jgi:lipopolysaccharide transport system permease protein
MSRRMRVHRRRGRRSPATDPVVTHVDALYASARPALRSPRRFVRDARSDLRVVPATAWRLFVHNIVAQHRQSRLRYAWLVLPAVANTAVWVYLDHQQIVDLGESSLPYAVYVLVGVVFWQLFVDALNAPLASLTAAKPVLTKVKLAHESWIAAGLLEAVFAFLVRSVVVAIVVAIYDVDVGWTVVLLPVLAAVTVLVGASLGLAITPVGLLYDDVGRAIGMATTLAFLLTPVVYVRPTSGTSAYLLRLNPMTYVLEAARAWLTDGEGARPVVVALIGLVATFLLVSVWLLNRVARPHVVARL